MFLLIELISELHKLCSDLSVSYWHGVVYYMGQHPVKIPPGGERVLRVTSSIAPELLRNGSYVLRETPEKMMNKENLSDFTGTKRSCMHNKILQQLYCK